MVIYWPLFLPVLTFETASVAMAFAASARTGSVEPSDMFSPESEPQGGQGDENRPHHISNSREPLGITIGCAGFQGIRLDGQERLLRL
jgi:hypothetical protein